MGNQTLLWCIASLLIYVACTEVANLTATPTNSSDADKDMYVIHAMVYQVGIVTNKTDNETDHFNSTGNQEALTFYHNNGSQVDLSQIPAPLLTNVTAQSLVGVAPVGSDLGNGTNILPWTTLNHLTDVPASVEPGQLPMSVATKSVRDVYSQSDNAADSNKSFTNFYKDLFKREIAKGNTPVAIRNGAALIPQSADVQSIAIPSLLTLNNNLSMIPVPIPNTSVVHYAKINTLITEPQSKE